MGALIFGCVAALAWGVHDFLVRYVSQTIGILTSLFAVMVFGVLLGVPVIVAFGEPGKMDPTTFGYSILAGIAFSVANIGLYNAFKRGPVRLVAPLISSYSVLSFFIAALNDSQISAQQWSALALLIFGIALVARSSAISGANEYSLSGTIAYCAIAIVGFALTFSLGQTASTMGVSMTSTLVARCTATLIIASVLAFSIVRSDEKLVFPGKFQILILALMGMLDVLALGVMFAAGVFEQPEFASASSSIFGLVTVLLAWTFLRENISFQQWLGIGIVFSAIAYLASSQI